MIKKKKTQYDQMDFEEREIVRIKKSRYFNEDFYLKENPDVKEAGVDAATHFYHYGWKENRNPSKKIDIKRFLNDYPEVKEIQTNPISYVLDKRVKVGKRYTVDKERSVKEEATKNLLDFKKILDDLEVTFWLDGGTLLGAYRDKDFCKDDEDDTDLCTWDNYLPIRPQIIKMAEGKGFTLMHEWELEICVGRNGARIDLFFNKRNGKEAYTHIYKGKEISKYVVIPIKYYERLVSIKFKGEKFLAPGPTEEFLELKYGNWRTPVHRSEYSCYNSKQNKLIREEYD